MKKGIFFILLSILLINCSLTAEKGIHREKYVFDDEQILSESQVDSLSRLFKNHEKVTSNQIVLVTTAAYGEHNDILEFSVEFGNFHEIGQRDKDNGVVIVISKTNREVRIATGYGLENVLRDEIAKSIIDNIMIPKFRVDDYFGGLYAGSKEITEILERPENRIE